MARRNKEFWLAKAKNDATFLYYYKKIIELGAASIRYKNCPQSINQRFLQLAIINDGKALLFQDDILGYLGLRLSPSSGFDAYGDPVGRRAYGVNGYNAERTDKNSVIIYNNYMRTSSIPEITLFADRLALLDRIMDINVNAQKTPLFVRCSEEQRLSILNMYKNYDGNEPIIYATKELDPQAIQAFVTGAPYVAGNLYELKTKIWNEVLTYWGIANISYTKKERMITDEVNRGLGGVMANRAIRLNEQIAALDRFNEMFGTNIIPYFDENCAECVDDIATEEEDNDV